MLVLTRKVLKPSNPKETVVLRSKATGKIIAKVGVTKIMGSKVKLGIAADDDIEIHRGEILKDGEGELVLEHRTAPSGLLKVSHGQGPAKQSA